MTTTTARPRARAPRLSRKARTWAHAAAIVVPVAAWAWATRQAPDYPLLWSGIGVATGAMVAVVAYGFRPRGLAVAIPAAAASAVSAAWVTTAHWRPAPDEWFWYATIGVAVAWAAGYAALRVTTKTHVRRKKGGPQTLRDALAHAGIPALALPREGERDAVKISAPKREGTGSTYTVDLPGGVTFDDVANRASRVAGAMSRRSTDLVIEVGSHDSEAVVWVGDQGAGARQAGTWPALTGPALDASAFDPINIGLDAQGRPVDIQLNNGSGVLIGALSGQGKSALMNLIMASLMSDSRVKASILDFKGGADFMPWQAAATNFYAGAAADDPAEVFRILQEFKDDMEAKTRELKRFRSSKITPEIADHPGMGPSLLIVDEAHELVGEKSELRPEDRNRAISLIRGVIARGRAVNSWVLIASQRVTAEEIPGAITQRVTTRVAFRLRSQPASEAVLGPDTWRQGYKATECRAPGIGFVSTDEGVTRVRAWFVPDEAAYELADRITRRGRSTAAAPLGVSASEPATEPLPVVVPEPLPAWVEDHAEVARLMAEQKSLSAVPGPVRWSRAKLVDMADEAWPKGQRGPRSAAWFEDIAGAFGASPEELREAFAEAGAPVDSVRYKVGGEWSDSRPGMTYAAFDEWAESV